MCGRPEWSWVHKGHLTDIYDVVFGVEEDQENNDCDLSLCSEVNNQENDEHDFAAKYFADYILNCFHDG
jgi:hypothetical protein